MSDREKRQLAWKNEVRVMEGDEGGRTLVSVAPPWDTLSVPIPTWDQRGHSTFRERFARGAFGGSIDGDVFATAHHDATQVLGRTPRTLQLTDTPNGLEYRVELPNTSVGNDILELVSRGDIRGSSFEFSVPEDGDEWAEAEDGTLIRTVRTANLYQVGPVTKPAYDQGTGVALRSYERFVEKQGYPRLEAAKRRLRLLEVSSTYCVDR